MPNVVAERLARVVWLEAESGLLSCEHVEEVHRRNDPLAACGLHPEAGLMCFGCMSGHADAVHGLTAPCDYCGRLVGVGELEVRQKVFSWWSDWMRVLPPGAEVDEVVVLTVPRVVGLFMPMACVGELCDRLAAAEIAEVNRELGLAS